MARSMEPRRMSPIPNNSCEAWEMNFCDMALELSKGGCKEAFFLWCDDFSFLSTGNGCSSHTERAMKVIRNTQCGKVVRVVWNAVASTN